jgi:hypothetical protein
MASKAEAKITTDHDEIRHWAEQRGGEPACVRGTGGGGDVGMLRIDFPGFSGEESLQHISWDDWFEKFDERGLALLHQEMTAGGAQSNFNKLVSRETAQQSQGRSRGKSAGGTHRKRASSSRKAASSSSRSGSSRSRSALSGRKSAGARKSAGTSKTSRSAGGTKRSSTGRSTSTGNRSAGKKTAAKKASARPAKRTGAPKKTGTKKKTASRSR